MPRRTARSRPPRRTGRHVPRSVAVLAGTLTALLLLVGGALAADDRVLVEAGADEVDRAALVAEVDRLEAEGLLLSVSVLADEPGGGAEAEADRLVDDRGGAALVITLTEVGGVSDDAGHDTSGAVDRALDALAEDDDIVAATTAFGEHLLDADAGADGVGGAGDVELPGLGGVSVTLIIIAVVGLVLLLSVFRFVGRLAGGGRRRVSHGGRRRRGGMLPGAAVGYGVGRAQRNRNRGVGGTTGGMSSGTSRGRASRGSSSRSRSSGSRSRSSGSRGGRSRGSGRRR